MTYKSVTWVLQKDSTFSANKTNDKIAKRLTETGHQCVELYIIAFSHEVEGGDPIIDGPVVAYGSTIIDEVVDRNNWKPGCFKSTGFEESVTREALGDLYMNNDMKILPCREAAAYAREQGWEFFFVKPNTGGKEFVGTITDAEKYPWFLEEALSYEHVSKNFGVCVSPIKEIGIEWRLPVVAGEVVDYSIYRQYMKVMPSREIYPEVLDFAREAVAIHNPSSAFVIDVGQVNGELKVIEYNAFNHAGLYACDIDRVVDAVNAMVINNIQLDHEIGHQFGNPAVMI